MNAVRRLLTPRVLNPILFTSHHLFKPAALAINPMMRPLQMPVISPLPTLNQSRDFSYKMKRVEAKRLAARNVKKYKLKTCKAL